MPSDEACENTSEGGAKLIYYTRLINLFKLSAAQLSTRCGQTSIATLGEPFAAPTGDSS